MADVNILFQAPMKPQSVLLFRLIFKMGALAAASIYLLFQIPNLHLNLGFPMGVCLSLLPAWVLTLVTGQLIAVLLYTVTANHMRLRKWILPGIIILCGGVLLAFSWYWNACGSSDPLMCAFAFFNAPASCAVPVWGWIKAVIDFSLAGQYWAAAGMALLDVLVIFGLIVVIWRIKADFYEDAMAKSEETAAILAAAKEKGSGVVFTRKKDRSEKLMRGGKMGGNGGTAIFCKNFYNRKRFARLGVITNTMIVYFLVAVLLSVILDSAMIVVIVALGVFVYFRALGSPVSSELKTDLFFMLPVGPYEKLFWTILSGSAACILDLLPALIVSTVLLHASPVTAVAGLLFIVALDFFMSCCGALADLSLPTSINQGVKTMIQIIIVYLGIGVLAAVGVAAALLFESVDAVLLAVAVMELALGFLAFAIAPNFLKNGRM